MSTYFISFRISEATVGGKTYSDRRELLMENARTEGLGFWDGTTSFIVTESNLDTNQFAAQVTHGLSKKHDQVLVFDPSDMSAVAFGPIEQATILASFFQHFHQ